MRERGGETERGGREREREGGERGGGEGGRERDRSTETMKIIRDGETRSSTSTFTQLLSSGLWHECIIRNTHSSWDHSGQIFQGSLGCFTVSVLFKVPVWSPEADRSSDNGWCTYQLGSNSVSTITYLSHYFATAEADARGHIGRLSVLCLMERRCVCLYRQCGTTVSQIVTYVFLVTRKTSSLVFHLIMSEWLRTLACRREPTHTQTHTLSRALSHTHSL